MQQLERYESTAAKPTRMHLSAGNCIRVTTGRLWITAVGRLEDTWLVAGEEWKSDVDQYVWLSGEPIGSFELVRPIAPMLPKRPGNALGRGLNIQLPSLFAASPRVGNPAI